MIRDDPPPPTDDDRDIDAVPRSQSSTGSRSQTNNWSSSRSLSGDDKSQEGHVAIVSEELLRK